MSRTNYVINISGGGTRMQIEHALFGVLRNVQALEEGASENWEDSVLFTSICTEDEDYQKLAKNSVDPKVIEALKKYRVHIMDNRLDDDSNSITVDGLMDFLREEIEVN